MEKPNYYGILPADVRYDNRLKPMEKIMYSEITALTNKNGYCNAKNQYFAELYEVHKNTVGAWINHLVELGYLKSILVKNDKKEIVGRRLYITIPTKNIEDPINENIDTYQQKDLDPINENIDTLSTKRLKMNNTSINITSRIIEREEKQEEEFEIQKPTQTPDPLEGNKGMYYQEIRNLIGEHTLNYEKIARYGKPISRIRDVIAFAEKYNKGDGWITEAIRDDYKLEPPKKKDIPKPEKKDYGKQETVIDKDTEDLYKTLGI